MRSRRDHQLLLATRRRPMLSLAQMIIEEVWTREEGRCQFVGCGRPLMRPGQSRDHDSTGYVYSDTVPMTTASVARLLCGPHFKLARP